MKTLAALFLAILSPCAHAWDESFMQLHRLMHPTPQELKWLEIDWKTDLWEARKEAAAKGKPIYLWEMDGHPLGCT